MNEREQRKVLTHIRDLVEKFHAADWHSIQLPNVVASARVVTKIVLFSSHNNFNVELCIDFGFEEAMFLNII